MRRAPIALVLTLTACSAASGELDAPDDAGARDASVHADADAGIAPDPTCPADGTHAFTVRGEGLTPHEGRTVTLTVIEPAPWSEDGGAPRRFSLAATITAGAFAVSCPAALRENFIYPSWAAVLDADGDGACSAADLGVQMQLYGWASAIDETIPADAWSPTATQQLHGPIGLEADSFCSGYFR